MSLDEHMNKLWTIRCITVYSDQNAGSLKSELKAILPELEKMKKRKTKRRNQFLKVLEQIQKIQLEIYETSYKTILDESDLSLRKLEELQAQLQTLEKEKKQKEKSTSNEVIERLAADIQRLHELLQAWSLQMIWLIDVSSLVEASLDYTDYDNWILGDVKEEMRQLLVLRLRHVKHLKLGMMLLEKQKEKSISNEVIGRLAAAIQRLREIQNLAFSLLELWNLMVTLAEEQHMFQSVTCKIAASEQEITEHNLLSVEFINYVETEVSRLESLKSSKMKELVMAIEAIETGTINPASLLEQIELQVRKVKEEALTRSEILEKVERWMAACEEECWLEEYNNDDNRYNARWGAHLTLKREEKARALVNKLIALAVRMITWENERGTEFNYDGIRLLSMLEEYKILRQEKEEERKRQKV
nr:hypothetical protein [Tanacetum cinerariifolium]